MATQAQVQAFIKTIAPHVINKCKQHGWGVPSAIIAQAGLESAWNTSGLSKTCYNFWGMKWREGCGCDYKAYNTNEQRSDGTYYTVVSKFRKYNSYEEGIEGYFRFIESYSRYNRVIAVKAGDYVGYATMIKECGWATSLKYTQNIINTVKKYNLTVYDTGVVTEPQSSEKSECPFLVKVIDKDLNIRRGAGTKYPVVAQITDHGIYTIVEVKGSWGRLKSGVGWICISDSYVTRL